MNADVNKKTNKNIIKSSPQDISGVNFILPSELGSFAHEAMDTANFQPLDESIVGLEKRGVSIYSSRHAELQKQQQHEQLSEQRLTAQQQLLQQQQQQQLHSVKQSQNIKSQVQPSQKIQNNKPKKNKVSAKRKKKDRLSSADSYSDLSDIADTSVNNNNRFALLNELDITTTHLHTVQINNSQSESKKTTTEHNYARTQAHSASNGVATSIRTNAIKRFCPPIILFNVDISGLVNQFKRKFPDIEIKIVNSSKNRSKLYVKDLHAYTIIMNILKEKNISSHSFTPAENKQLSIIVRGLHRQTLPEEIKAELESIIPNTVSDVKNFITPFMKKNGVVSDLFLVTLLPGKTDKEIKNINYILFQKIKWEKPLSSSKDIQCKRCQRWGHIAKNCNHFFQCVKCDKSHEPGKCELVQNEDSRAYCVNCKQWGHPANFKGCEVYKLMLANKLSKARKASQAKARASVPFSSSLASPARTYASLLRHNNNNNNSTLNNRSNNSKLISDFMAVAREILGAEPLPLETRIHNFLKNFKTLSPEDKKTECLALLQEIGSANV